MTRDTFDMFEKPERGRFGDNESAPLRSPGSSDKVDLTLILRQDRPLALMVHRPEQLRKETWISLPKSAVEYELVAGGAVIVRLSERLAKEKGLI